MNLTVVEITLAIDHHGMHAQTSLRRHAPDDTIKTTLIFCHQKSIRSIHVCIGRVESGFYAYGNSSRERNQRSVFADGLYRTLFKLHGNILCRERISLNSGSS